MINYKINKIFLNNKQCTLIYLNSARFCTAMYPAFREGPEELGRQAYGWIPLRAVLANTSATPSQTTP
jgi:hypothetical protein